jgi:hypothetical protein
MVHGGCPFAGTILPSAARGKAQLRWNIEQHWDGEHRRAT